MKKLLVLFLLLFAGTWAFAQTGDLKTKTIHLDNGLKVVMCEDHSKPEVYGAVYVHAGSKNDPVDATGMAHYFEHIMFKGTDQIGTTNWEAEKVFLDSIDLMYDRLHETTDIAERQAIQQKINVLSQKSADYAIPNEVDVILTQMGGKLLNAGTSYDMTVYYNMFPSNQLSKWMDVYVERFRNPVFRLFQSELETVYEEKNMYGDSPINAFQEYLFHETFGDHPYGRPVIGYTEHLKNPQTSKMREFYNTYYVANNMTLILVGDFNIEATEPMVAEKFGTWRKGTLPKQPEYNLPKFNGPTVKEVRMTPIKMGTLVYPGVKNSDPDVLPLTLACSIFANGETGLMDKLMKDGKIMAAMMMPLSLEDYGANVMIYVPKLLGQSHEKAEELIFGCLDQLKKGEFSDDLFEAMKMSMLTERLKETESLESLAGLFLEMEMSGQSLKEYEAETERLKSITKAEVVAIANKYFTNDYLDLRSKMGFPAKDKVDKPNWKPIEAKNTEAKSDFAKAIEAQEMPEVEPQVVKIGKDVLVTEVNDSFKLFSASNQRNDIFDLKLNFNYGTADDPDLGRAALYFSMQGTTTQTPEEFALELQKLGAEVDFYASENQFTVHLTGFEKDLNTIMALCNSKLQNPSNEEKYIQTIVENEQGNLQTSRDDASTWAQAVREYALYVYQSTFLNHASLKEWGKRKGADLLAEVAVALKYDGYVLYSGNTKLEEVARMLKENKLVKPNAIKGQEKIRVEKKYTEPQVFIASNKKFRQSNIYFYVPGEKLSVKDEALASLFSKYFGTDMYSIVFQEIREFRSLGYTAYANYRYDYLERKPGNLFGFLGTQSDKTIDGMNAFKDLIVNMPVRMEKFNASKEALLKSRASNYIDFRSLPSSVQTWMKMGYDHDPRGEVTEIIRKANFEDVQSFYDRLIKDRPVVIMMSGNEKKIDKNELGKFGTVNKLKYKQIIKE
ncbi:MAG: insulinase family protein [Bacteroidales bacterium]|nr:insulinase family protein [Bacteroidales bacterium]